jgi:hypothetical protein
MQLAVNTTIEKETILWFAHIHCWATDIFSMDPARDYISSPIVNQRPVVEGEREWASSSAVKVEVVD